MGSELQETPGKDANTESRGHSPVFKIASLHAAPRSEVTNGAQAVRGGLSLGFRGGAGAGGLPGPSSRRAGSRDGLSPGRPGRRPPPARLTCLKQKGMVRTLTPTMLFTMFVISPQLEAAAAVMARGLGPRSPGSKAPAGRWGARPRGGRRLEEAVSREGGGSSHPPGPARPRGRLIASSPAGSRGPPQRPRAQTGKSRGEPARNTPVLLGGRLGTHTSAFRELLRPEVTTRGGARGRALTNERRTSAPAGAGLGWTHTGGVGTGSMGRTCPYSQLILPVELASCAMSCRVWSTRARPLWPPSGRAVEGRRERATSRLLERSRILSLHFQQLPSRPIGRSVLDARVSGAAPSCQR